MGFFDFLSGKPSPEKFARRMADAMRKNGVAGAIEYDAQSFALRFDGHFLSLGNAYADYNKATRSERAHVIAAYLPVATDEPVVSDNLEEAREHLRPKVREPVFYSFMKLRREIEGADYPISTHKRLTVSHRRAGL